MTEDNLATAVPAVVDAPPPPPRLTFDDLPLEPELRQAVADMGYVYPTDVQAAVFAAVVAGRDVMVESRTGTGKTTAFGLPIVQRLDPGVTGAQVLMLAPTRELALQVADELKRLCKYKSLSVVPVYGGAAMGPQVDAFQAGAQIVVGTPGRVLDHIRRRTFKTGGIRHLVLDECDEMLSMGFAEEIDAILSTLPPREERQTLLFSATIPEAIERIGRRQMRTPEKISLIQGDISVAEIEHRYYMVSGMAWTKDLLKILKVEKPESAIIFCNTREDTNTVARYLVRNGYDAEAISSDLTQKDRERVMGRSRAKNLQFLVATDIAARGIDISDLSHVINYTFPDSPEIYVHRTGRTGRAGKSGVAISMIGPRDIGSFYMLKLTYKIRPVERELPTAEEFQMIIEGERFEKVVKLVGEAPASEWRSLARRLWQSEDGERVVAALLERLLTLPPPRAEAEPVRLRHAERDDRPREDRGGRDRDRGGRDRDRGGRDRDRVHNDRPRDERPRDEERPMAVEGEAAEAVPVDAPVDAGGVAAEASADGAASGGEERDPRRRRRRRRGEGREGGREGGREARGGGDRGGRPARAETSRGVGPAPARKPIQAPGDGREFWEAWADEKTGRADSAPPAEFDGEPTVPGRRSARVQTAPLHGNADAAGEDDGNSAAEAGLARLYINIGKRESASADDIRALLSAELGDDAGKIGSIALRNTHAYVRVPEDMVERVIGSMQGKAFAGRDIQIERARR